jgi:hypothetical protein
MSMKNFNDSIGNRNRDLPSCSAVPQPTALARAPYSYITGLNFLLLVPMIKPSVQEKLVNLFGFSAMEFLFSKLVLLFSSGLNRFLWSLVSCLSSVTDCGNGQQHRLL